MRRQHRSVGTSMTPARVNPHALTFHDQGILVPAADLVEARAGGI